MKKNKSKTNILETSKLPDDLKHFCKQDMLELAKEIREKLIQIKDKCGGHLASNLGVVELTIALHAVFDSPKDKILWDVSHQCYVHKMLTGRLAKIFTLRTYKGLSGFTNSKESVHDAFGAGHASTALSAGLGIAHARDSQKKNYSVIAVIGDGSLSGGMSYEALNNVDKMKGNFICILNDNDMSISHPVGGMAKYITSLRTAKVYNKLKHKIERIFDYIPLIGVPLKRRIEKMVELLRRSIVTDTKAGVIFEEFGFRYIGPLDGHNIPVVMAALKYAKSYPGPIMIHIITKKGKGYAPAEQDPVSYHGVSPKNGDKKTTKKLLTYTQVFGEEIIKIAKKDPKITVITPAMCEGSGLSEYAKKFPNRYFDVGIAEEHAVTFAAGLAKAGMKPVLAIYSSFLQRGFDQLIHDVSLQHLPVIFAIDRAGLVGEDGPTHHGVFDYSFLLPIPNLTILAPKDGYELRQMLNWAATAKGPVSIRYPRGLVPIQDGKSTNVIKTNKAEVLKGKMEEKKVGNFDVLLIATGSMVWPAVSVSEVLDDKNISNAVINLRFIKPLDIKLLEEYVNKSKKVFVLEEGNIIGGVHAHILQALSSKLNELPPIHSISLPDKFARHGDINLLKKEYGLLKEQILARILERLAI